MPITPETARSAPMPPQEKVVAATLAIVTCNALWLSGAIILTTFYYWIIPSGTGNFFVPVLVFSGLWLVLFGLTDKSDHAAMNRQGQPPVEGMWTAVCGTAHALDEAPDDILACRFQVLDRVRRTHRDDRSDTDRLACRFDGFYLVPTAIKTETGIVPLAGFPDLIHLDKVSIENDLLVRAKEAAWKCPRYLPKPVARELVLSGVQDRVETSLKYGDEPESSTGNTKAWLLRSGDPVCVFGRWQNGTLHSVKSRPRGLPVYAGTSDVVRARLGGDSHAFLVLGAVLLAAAMALAVWPFL